MPEPLQKLQPDRDLQCYFYTPSAIAALSSTSPSSFTVSGCWRQQFDWAVVEWNRDNVFEHPALRNLPDGDLSGLHLSYQETRTNCISLDSDWYPTVDWPYLRVWAEASGAEQVYQVKLSDHATPMEGSYGSASAIFELQGTPTQDDYIEFSWLDEHYTYQLYYNDTIESAAQGLASGINAYSTTMTATCSGAQIRLEYKTSAGANGNRIGVHAGVAGVCTESWSSGFQMLSGGTSPVKWSISLDFSSLTDIHGVTVPTNKVRKLRWTYAADLQPAAFLRSEFQVVISNWTVTGANRGYSVAGAGSQRIEDSAGQVIYSGQWTESRGNFSGGSIRFATTPGAALSCTYSTSQSHQLYFGTRKAEGCASISITVDGVAIRTEDLHLAGEDVLMRIPLGQFAAGVHRLQATHTGSAGTYFYFDFLEAAIPTTTLPAFPADLRTTLATDWDTLHSQAIAPERTAWFIDTLGFKGRANHYAGALWFFELSCPGQQYASASVTFSGTPEFGKTTELNLGGTPLDHVSLKSDTLATIAHAFALMINQGSTGVWAEAQDATLTLHARAMGTAGNGINVTLDTNNTEFTATVSGPLAGGVDGLWLTDLRATPRLNRAARDWHRSFFQALKGYGIDVAAAFSTELQFGDPSPAAGIAQRYPDGSPVMVNTPALQTNFSPTSLAFWQQTYLDMANVFVEAGLQPYLQFGEIQWWYFPKPGVGMTFYDAYTTGAFQSACGRALPVFPDGSAQPAQFPQECAFLSGLIGSFTDAIMTFVRRTCPTARFEVLYPPDTNAAPLMPGVNLPSTHWTPAKLDCLKTENFTYTGDRDLNKATSSVMLPSQLGFPPSQSAHLVGIGDYTTPWLRESGIAKGAGASSVVLFALDQFCLIGYSVPVDSTSSRSLYMGA